MRLATVQYLTHDMSPPATPEEQAQIMNAVIYPEGGSFEPDDEGRFKFWYTAVLVDLDLMPDRVWPSMKDIKLVRPDLFKVPVERNTPAINQRINVAVPGNALLKMNRVMVETDCCTDHLNRRLNEGWRILAICPQPDQRRPDYILGCIE